jgi:hypothetical protein
MNEPRKEILRIGDILAWAPGVTAYQVEQLIENGVLKLYRFPGTRPDSKTHRRFLKAHVFDVVIKPLLQTQTVHPMHGAHRG